MDPTFHSVRDSSCSRSTSIDARPTYLSPNVTVAGSQKGSIGRSHLMTSCRGRRSRARWRASRGGSPIN